MSATTSRTDRLSVAVILVSKLNVELEERRRMKNQTDAGWEAYNHGLCEWFKRHRERPLFEGPEELLNLPAFDYRTYL